MDACYKWLFCDCRQRSRSWWRCNCELMLLLMLMLTCCHGAWIQKPQDASQRLNHSVTFNCSGGDGSHNVLWSKEDVGVLFINTDSWSTGVTRRMRAVTIPSGVSLTLTLLEQSDDGGYRCQISDIGLNHTARLTVLGMSLRLCLSVSVCLCLCHALPENVTSSWPPAQNVAFQEVFSGHHHLILTAFSLLAIGLSVPTFWDGSAV